MLTFFVLLKYVVMKRLNEKFSILSNLSTKKYLKLTLFPDRYTYLRKVFLDP